MSGNDFAAIDLGKQRHRCLPMAQDVAVAIGLVGDDAREVGRQGGHGGNKGSGERQQGTFAHR